jgi:hypothetical protein
MNVFIKVPFVLLGARDVFRFWNEQIKKFLKSVAMECPSEFQAKKNWKMSHQSVKGLSCLNRTLSETEPFLFLFCHFVNYFTICSQTLGILKCTMVQLVKIYWRKHLMNVFWSLIIRAHFKKIWCASRAREYFPHIANYTKKTFNLQILYGRTLQISKFLNSENVVLFLDPELTNKSATRFILW